MSKAFDFAVFTLLGVAGFAALGAALTLLELDAGGVVLLGVGAVSLALWESFGAWAIWRGYIK